jgi:hypothetical protein
LLKPGDPAIDPFPSLTTVQLTTLPTEQTTAATDALLALVGLWSAERLWRRRRAEPWKAGIWAAMFVLVALAAALGTLAHGLELEPRLHAALWYGVNAALGQAVGFFALGAAHDAWGQPVTRRLLPGLVALGLLFLLITVLAPDRFVLFIIYESLAMALALIVYLVRAVYHPCASAAWMLAGVVLTILAAGCQTALRATIQMIWPFDHNGLFHLVQLSGVLCLLAGLKSCLPQTGRDRPPGPIPAKPPPQSAFAQSTLDSRHQPPDANEPPKLRGRLMSLLSFRPVMAATALWFVTLAVGAGAVLGGNAGLAAWITIPALLWLTTLGAPTTLGLLLVASLWGRVSGLSGIGPFLGCGAAVGLVLEIIACIWVRRCWLTARESTP